MATKHSKVMNNNPGPRPSAKSNFKHHPAVANMNNNVTVTSAAGKGGPKDSMRPTIAGQGPAAMLTPVKPGKNDMNANPR